LQGFADSGLERAVLWLGGTMTETQRITKRRLIRFVLKPTLYCFHQCKYCDPRQDYYKGIMGSRAPVNGRQTISLHKRSEDKAGHMPHEMALRSIEDAARLGMTSLQLSGGDPLLYPHIEEVIRHGAGQPGVFVFMNSVGTGVTTERATALIEAGLGAWNFSIDTLNPETFDLLRGTTNGLERSLSAIEVVRQAATPYPDFCINYMSVITRQSFRDLPDLFRHCVDRGVASVYLMNVYGDRSATHLLSRQEISQFRDDIVPAVLSTLSSCGVSDLVLRNAESVLKTFFSRENSDENYEKGIYWPDKDSVHRACDTPNNYALVEPDGRVLPCCLVEISHQGEVGNISGQTLDDVWTSDAFEAFRTERIDFCQQCSSPRNRTVGLIDKMCRQFDV